MNVLLLCPYLPWPPSFGGSVRIYHLARQLARRHRLSILALQAPHDPDDTSVLAGFCHEVLRVPRPGPGKRLGQLLSLVSPRSYQTSSHCSAAVQRALDEAVRRLDIDLIVVEFSQMMGLRFPAGIPVVLDEHNVEYDLLERMAAQGGWLRRFYNRTEARKFRAEEAAAARRAALTLLTSARDEELLRREVPSMRSAVITNGVDTRHFARPAGRTRKPDTAVFVGATHYFPNEDGVLFFLREVLDLVLAQVPGFRLQVVGGRPGPALLAAAAGRPVEVTGFVDDVRPYMWDAPAFVVPLRMGGGTRFKVVEAMAAGVPVVSTTLGAEGIPVTSGKDLLLADTPADFAAALVRVLREPDLCGRLSAAGLDLVHAEFEWDILGDRLEQAVAGLGRT